MSPVHLRITRGQSLGFRGIIAGILSVQTIALVVRSLNFSNITTEWDSNSKRATKITFRGEVQCVTSREFSEYKCEVPPNMRVREISLIEYTCTLKVSNRNRREVIVQVPLKQGQELIVGFCSEDCTEHRSASCKLNCSNMFWHGLCEFTFLAGELGQVPGLICAPIVGSVVTARPSFLPASPNLRISLRIPSAASSLPSLDF